MLFFMLFISFVRCSDYKVTQDEIQLFVYHLRLEGDYHYVGITKNLNQRWTQHTRGKGSKWTKLHRPIIITNFWVGSQELENNKTYELMDKYGIDKVRGGICHCPILSDCEKFGCKYSGKAYQPMKPRPVVNLDNLFEFMRKKWVQELIDDSLRNDWYNINGVIDIIKQSKLPTKFITDLDYNDISVTNYMIDTIRTDDRGKYYIDGQNGKNPILDCKNLRYYLFDGSRAGQAEYPLHYKPMIQLNFEIKPEHCSWQSDPAVAQFINIQLGEYHSIFRHASDIFNWEIEWSKHQFTKQPYLDIKTTFLKNYGINRLSMEYRGNTIKYSGIANYLLKKRESDSRFHYPAYGHINYNGESVKSVL